MPTCFSPLTTRLPLGSTSTTVTVMVPANWFSLPAAPLPSKLLLVEASSPSLPSLSAFTNGKAPNLADPPPLRSMVLLELCLATSRSSIRIVSMSPGWRARRSSNMLRVAPAWKMDPLASRCGTARIDASRL